MTRKQSADPIRTFQRSATAARRVGIDAKCACGEDRPEALIAGSKPTICAECDRKRKGHATEDNHHPAGKANSPLTIPIPVNDHRAILSVAQYDWPKDTLKNPNADPILQVAAWIRCYLDMHRYLAEKFLSPAIARLESLAGKNENAEE